MHSGRTECDKRLRPRREQYRLRRNGEMAEERQIRLEQHREYDRRRHAAMAMEQRQNLLLVLQLCMYVSDYSKCQSSSLSQACPLILLASV